MNLASARTPRVFGLDSEYLSPSDERVGLPIAIGNEALVVVRELKKSLVHFLFPASRSGESPAEKFARLAYQWKHDTAFVSAVHTMSMRPEYQQIIGMGDAAIPLMLSELAREPDHWFWALNAITGVDPVRPSDRGDIQKMAQAWLKWGRATGFLKQ